LLINKVLREDPEYNEYHRKNLSRDAKDNAEQQAEPTKKYSLVLSKSQNMLRVGSDYA